MAAVTVTSQIPPELAALLSRISDAEERSKSYYIKKGLELILHQRLEDLEDYGAAVAAYDAHVAGGGAALSLEEAFADE